MNKRTQFFIWFFAVIVTVGLVLRAAPTQAHYVTQAKWQEPYAPVFVSDYLTAGPSTCCVDVQEPAEDTAVSVAVHFQFCDTVATGENEERELHLSAVSSHAAVSVPVLPTYILSGDQRAYVAIPLTVHPVNSPVLVSVTVNAVCEGESLQTTILVPVFPVSEGAKEHSQLFTMPEAQTYAAGQPVLVTFRAMTATGKLTIDGSQFPVGTRYSTDGVNYVTLCEAAAIPLRAGQSHVTLQLPDAYLPALSLRLEMGNQWDSRTLSAAAVSGEIDRSQSALSTGELWVYVPCLRIMENSNVSAQAEISVLSLVEEPAPAEAEEATVTTLQLVPLEDDCPFAFDWGERDELYGRKLHVYPADPSAPDQGNEPAEEARENGEDAFAAPAGTYRLTIRWKLGGAVVYTETIDFFVQR